jgi:redox-sensitive bicupin YhaK (pirin superfamily)
MEILTYVLEGALEHKDSMGNGSTIKPGIVQRMSAGTGVTHSEYNASQTDPVHLLQIWILPEANGIAPGYEERAFELEQEQGRLELIADRHGQNGALTLHQDVSLFAARLGPDQTVEHTLAPGRHAWLQVARGRIALNDTPFEAGDGAAVNEEDRLEIQAADAAEILLFDLA